MKAMAAVSAPSRMICNASCCKPSGMPQGVRMIMTRGISSSREAAAVLQQSQRSSFVARDSDLKAIGFNLLSSSSSRRARQEDVVEARATTAAGGGAESAGEGEAADSGTGVETAATQLQVDVDGSSTSEWGKTLRLGSLFGLWYLFNIYFNIYNKQACPTTMTPAAEEQET